MRLFGTDSIGFYCYNELYLYCMSGILRVVYHRRASNMEPTRQPLPSGSAPTSLTSIPRTSHYRLPNAALHVTCFISTCLWLRPQWFPLRGIDGNPGPTLIVEPREASGTGRGLRSQNKMPASNAGPPQPVRSSPPIRPPLISQIVCAKRKRSSDSEAKAERPAKQARRRRVTCLEPFEVGL